MSFLAFLQGYVVNIFAFFHFGESLPFETDDFVVTISYEFFRLDFWCNWAVFFDKRVLIDVGIPFDYSVFEFGVIDFRSFVVGKVQGQGVVRV